jgi:hypothetical protein
MTVILHVPVFNRRKARSGKAAKIPMTKQLKFSLEDIRRSVKAPKRSIQRATVVLLIFPVRSI